MGFLKRLFKNTYRDGELRKGAAASKISPKISSKRHMNIAKYGNFMLTDAIRPSYDLQVVPGPAIATTPIMTGTPASRFRC